MPNSGEATRAYADAMAGAAQTRLRPTPAGAFARAREWFRAGNRLDMAALAADLGVSRATLYRWTGDRDRLLADVCVAELADLIQHFDASVEASGADRLGRVAAQFLDTLAASGAFRRFLERERDHGLRIVTASEGRVRPRLVAMLEAVIEREAGERGYRPPAAPRVLADGIVAIGERFLYHGGDPALNPDPATAREVIKLLLRED